MKKYAILILSGLTALMMINSGFNKFFHYMPIPEMEAGAMQLMGAFVASKWMMPMIAITEIIGGILLIIPKTRALGAIVLLPVLVSIFLIHAVQDPGNVAVAIIMLLIDGWIIYENRAKYLPMIS